MYNCQLKCEYICPLELCNTQEIDELKSISGYKIDFDKTIYPWNVTVACEPGNYVSIPTRLAICSATWHLHHNMHVNYSKCNKCNAVTHTSVCSTK